MMCLKNQGIRGKMEMSYEKEAVEYFANNFNCSQSVFVTYAKRMGIDEPLALRIATNFGGGARKGEMCGAVSGALMVLGLLEGHCDSEDIRGKKRAYEISEEFMNRFIKANKSVVCRDLLGYDLSIPKEHEEIEKKGSFHTVCPKMVESAVKILEEMIRDKVVSGKMLAGKNGK